jgi:hypothetical protein
MELSLAGVLDGLISWPGRGQRTRVQFWVRELPGERNVQALDIDESVRREELLARARPAERHHHSRFPTFSAAARRNGASAHAPVDTFR